MAGFNEMKGENNYAKPSVAFQTPTYFIQATIACADPQKFMRIFMDT